MDEKGQLPPSYDPNQGYAPPQQGYPPQGYPQGAVGYNPGQQQVVTGQAYPGTTTVVVAQAAPRPASYLGFSIFVLLCCNLLCGIIALIFSIMSNSASDRGDMESGRSNGKIALGLNIAGIITTVIIVVVVVVLVFTAPWIFYAAAVNAVYG